MARTKENQGGQPTDTAIAPEQRSAGPSERSVRSGPETRPPAAEPATGSGWTRRLTNPSFVAVASWLISLPIALLVARLAKFDPFSNRGWNSSLAVGLVIAAALLAISVRLSATEAVAGLAAGAWASWVGFTLRTALAGTPFAFGGVQGDAGRISAMATRYSETPFSADTFVQGVPSEYPMFFPWVIGRTAALIDVPAWRLVGLFEVVTMSAGVLVAFLLWRRLVPSWVAFAVSVLMLPAFGDPRKAYEVITLAVFIPWLLEALGRPPGRRMHWLLGGLCGGFVVMTYQGWFMFGILALLGVVVVTWRNEDDRRAYVFHVLKTAGFAAVVASMYLVPYIWGIVMLGTDSVADIYVPGSLNFEVFPFLREELISVVEVIGLVGLLWLRRTAWWATPLLWLVGGSFLYRILAMVYFGLTKRTLLLHYTVHMYETALVIAGVLTVAYVTPLVLKRLALVPPRGAAAALLTVVVACTGYIYSRDWIPAAGRPVSTYTAAAHNEPLPSEGYPRFARNGSVKRLPVTAIEQAVEGELGPNPKKVTLAADERLYSYLPWPGYVGLSQSASSSLVHWNERYAEVKRVAATTDPAEFARVSADTSYGPIDVFILNRSGADWSWRTVKFSPAQFAPSSWTVVELDEGIVVAIRR